MTPPQLTLSFVKNIKHKQHKFTFLYLKRQVTSNHTYIFRSSGGRSNCWLGVGFSHNIMNILASCVTALFNFTNCCLCNINTQLRHITLFCFGGFYNTLCCIFHTALKLSWKGLKYSIVLLRE